MTAKEELNQYKWLNNKCDRLKEEQDRINTLATSTTSSMSNTTSKTNLPSDKVGNNSAILIDLEEEIKKLKEAAEIKRLELVCRIEKISEPNSTLLYKRYIELKDFNDIADEIGYSYGITTHMHGDALEEYESKYELSKKKQDLAN